MLIETGPATNNDAIASTAIIIGVLVIVDI
jgi:hypothetical protein